MADPGADEPDLEKRVVRLERRIARERSARMEAEKIADRGMRELWLANCELDERVAERTADLESTLQELEIASTARERFLSVLSHEMRTPLNGVLGMLELLDPYTSGDQGAKYLRAARDSAAGLDNLVRRLLDLVELATGSMSASVTPTTAAELVAEVQAKWQTKALKSGHLLTISSFFGNEHLNVDSGRIHQMIDELVDNALAYASPGAIKIRFLPAGANVVIEVEDSGPGFSDDILDGLFERLDNADMATNRASQGLGLGLGLSRRIAEALGGTLDIESSNVGPNPATVARLTMPAGLTSEHQKKAA